MKDVALIFLTVAMLILALTTATFVINRMDESVSIFTASAKWCNVCENTTIDNKTACEMCDEFRSMMSNVQSNTGPIRGV
jgi:hypothetical protein